MKLVHDHTGKEVQVGDQVRLWGEEVLTVVEVAKPALLDGKVYLETKDGKLSGYFPSAIGAHWVEREDQDE